MTAPYAVGDHVIANPLFVSARFTGIVYTVTKIGPVNLTLHPLIPGGRGVLLKPEQVLPAPAEAVAASKEGRGVAISVPNIIALEEGMVVTVAGPGWKQPADELYVVLAEKNDTYRIIKLGGNNRRYWRAVSRGMLTKVDATRITLTPAP